MTTQLPSKEYLAELAHNILSCHEVKPAVVKAMAAALLSAHEQEPVGVVRYVDAGLVLPGIHVSLYRTDLAEGTELFTRPAPSIPATELTVWYGSMPETNGKSNWTAMLHRKDEAPWDGIAITIDRSEYPDRVRYEADRMRYLIGEIGEEPDILAYDGDAHSGYVAPVRAPSIPAVPEDSRADFENFARLEWRLAPSYFDVATNGEYCVILTNDLWRAYSTGRAAMHHSGDVTDKAEPVARSDERLMEMPTDDEILLAIEGITTGDGWIPVSERLPKKGERILIFIDFNSQSVPPSIHDAEYTGATFRRGEATVKAEDGFGVTHWQPLPAAPKGV